jgi:hypothetical protein
VSCSEGCEISTGEAGAAIDVRSAMLTISPSLKYR